MPLCTSTSGAQDGQEFVCNIPKSANFWVHRASGLQRPRARADARRRIASPAARTEVDFWGCCPPPQLLARGGCRATVLRATWRTKMGERTTSERANAQRARQRARQNAGARLRAPAGAARSFRPLRVRLVAGAYGAAAPCCRGRQPPRSPAAGGYAAAGADPRGSTAPVRLSGAPPHRRCLRACAAPPRAGSPLCVGSWTPGKPIHDRP